MARLAIVFAKLARQKSEDWNMLQLVSSSQNGCSGGTYLVQNEALVLDGWE